MPNAKLKDYLSPGLICPETLIEFFSVKYFLHLKNSNFHGPRSWQNLIKDTYWKRQNGELRKTGRDCLSVSYFSSTFSQQLLQSSALQSRKVKEQVLNSWIRDLGKSWHHCQATEGSWRSDTILQHPLLLIHTWSLQTWGLLFPS